MDLYNRIRLKVFYSSKTYNLLNHFTLQISDKNIRKEYNTALGNNFDRLFCNTVIIASVYTILRLALFNYDEPNYATLMGTSLHWLLIVAWAFLKCCCKNHAPKVVLLYCFAWCLYTNLSWRDQLPESMREPNKRND